MDEEQRRCEKCGAKPQGYDMLDYCAICSKDLCRKCMAEKGCCGHIPALSGEKADFGEENTQ